MRCGIELSADQILGEPDDQVVIHGHLHPLAQRPLTLACAPGVGDIAALPVKPLSRAIFVEQADGNTQRGNAPVAGQPLSVTCVVEGRSGRFGLTVCGLKRRARA
jgi:hypothetical protein